jgi:CheY-like chemotaxis protein
MRMLVVDDEPLVHRAVHMVLRREHEIVDKMSAEEALVDLEEELEQGKFDVVLLDVKMPGVPDGIDFFRRLQQIDPEHAPAVIFMTGDPNIAGALGETMRTRCLSKPFAASELREALDELFFCA